MVLTPDEILAKADRLSARGPGRITLSPETWQLILDALRLYATACPARQVNAYVVEAWSGRVEATGEAYALCAKWGAAKAAYDAVCQEYPTYRVILRKDCRVINVRDSTTVRW